MPEKRVSEMTGEELAAWKAAYRARQDALWAADRAARVARNEAPVLVPIQDVLNWHDNAD